MKKTLIAGAASVALAAMPVLGVFAANIDITDSLSVTVGEACSFERGATEGTYSLELQPNSEVTQFDGSSTYTIKCNNAKGYTVTAAFNGLEGDQVSPATKESIAYSTSALAKGTAGWSAFKDGGTTAVTNNSEVHSGSATTTGDSFTMTYKVATAANQAQGTYSGTAKYTFAQK